jgi:hypothetical protein
VVLLANHHEGGFARSGPGSDEGANSSSDSNTGASRRSAASGSAEGIQARDAYERR